MKIHYDDDKKVEICSIECELSIQCKIKTSIFCVHA
jgi:hypothetical protein